MCSLRCSRPRFGQHRADGVTSVEASVVAQLRWTRREPLQAPRRREHCPRGSRPRWRPRAFRQQRICATRAVQGDVPTDGGRAVHDDGPAVIDTASVRVGGDDPADRGRPSHRDCPVVPDAAARSLRDGRVLADRGGIPDGEDPEGGSTSALSAQRSAPLPIASQTFAARCGTVAGPSKCGRARPQAQRDVRQRDAGDGVHRGRGARRSGHWLVEVEADAMLPARSCPFIIGTCRSAGTIQPER
jgi:hypothetical protein